MGNKPVISKQEILDTAFSIATAQGLSGLSIREVARACDVAVGTVYHSYPTKSDLMNDVVGKFWNESLADRMPRAVAGDNFVDFCERLATELSQAVKRFRKDWLGEVSALNVHDLEAARQREEACFVEIRSGLAAVLRRDPNIDCSQLTGPLAPEALCALVWDSMLSSMRRGDEECATLLALLRRTLYQ